MVTSRDIGLINPAVVTWEPISASSGLTINVILASGIKVIFKETPLESETMRFGGQIMTAFKRITSKNAATITMFA